MPVNYSQSSGDEYDWKRGKSAVFFFFFPSKKIGAYLLAIYWYLLDLPFTDCTVVTSLISQD